MLTTPANLTDLTRHHTRLLGPELLPEGCQESLPTRSMALDKCQESFWLVLSYQQPGVGPGSGVLYPFYGRIKVVFGKMKNVIGRSNMVMQPQYQAQKVTLCLASVLLNAMSVVVDTQCESDRGYF